MSTSEPVSARHARSHPASRARRSGRREGSLRESQRARLLAAISLVVSQEGARGASVERVITTAGLSRTAFYAIFADLEDCLLAAFNDSLALAEVRIGAACEGRAQWPAGIRAGLHALLGLFDEQPALAQLLLVHSLAAGPDLLAARAGVLERLAAVIDEGRAAARAQPPPLTAEAVVGGALSVIHNHMLAARAESLTELLNPLMGFILGPYRGAATARLELGRPAIPPSPSPPPSVTVNPLDDLGMQLTYRTMRVLAAVAADPGLSNLEVSVRAGVSDQGQISKLLARLAGLGLLENHGDGQARGAANSWCLTPRGVTLQRALGPQRTPANGRAPR
jgi:AcrR family transcriptional regulator